MCVFESFYCHLPTPEYDLLKDRPLFCSLLLSPGLRKYFSHSKTLINIFGRLKARQQSSEPPQPRLFLILIGTQTFLRSPWKNFLFCLFSQKVGCLHGFPTIMKDDKISFGVFSSRVKRGKREGWEWIWGSYSRASLFATSFFT